MATTVEEEVAIALEWRSTPADEMRSLVDDALRVMDLTRLATRSVFTLSSGERQKCVIASVIAAKADIVVMDEPTANLSPEATEELSAVVAGLKAAGVAVFIVDHRLYWLKDVADRMLVLKDGEVASCIEGAQLKSASFDPSWGLRSLDVARPALPVVARTRDAAVEISHLSFRYRRRAPFVYKDFSCAIPRGKITAIVGANGAGKTTLARLVCGLLKPSSGLVAMADGAASRISSVSFVMQQMDIQLYMKTVLDELMYSAPRKISKAERLADAEKWLATFGLSHLRARHPHSLSGGECERLVIACALYRADGSEKKNQDFENQQGPVGRVKPA